MRSQRLVHEQEPGAREQRSRDGHALPLATGKVRRRPIEQVSNAEKFDHGLNVGEGPGPAAFATVGEIASDREVAKKARVLEYVLHGTFVRRHEHPAVIVLPTIVAHMNGATRTLESREHTQARGLARAGGPEQCRDSTARQIQRDAKPKAAKREVKCRPNAAGFRTVLAWHGNECNAKRTRSEKATRRPVGSRTSSQPNLNMTP